MVSFNLLNYNIQDTVMNTSIKQPRMVNPGTEQCFIRQNSEPGGLEVNSELPFLEIDYQPCWNSIGFGTMDKMTALKQLAAKGFQVADEATRRIVQQGNMVEENRTPPSEIKRQEFRQKNAEPDTGLTFIPGDPPDLTITPGSLDIEHRPTDLSIDWENTGIVPYQLDRGTVTFDIAQKAYVDITYMGEPMFFPDENFQAWA